MAGNITAHITYCDVDKCSVCSGLLGEWESGDQGWDHGIETEKMWK